MPIYWFDYRREVSDNIFPYTTLKSSKFKRALFSIHVFDLVDAIILAAKEGKNSEIYNVGSGKEVSVNFIAEKIGGSKINIPKRPGESDRSLADISKIKSELNWN